MSKYLASVESLLFNEKFGVIGYANRIKSANINKKMRNILVDWLFEVFVIFKLKFGTMFLTINILDAFICRSENVNKENLQLVGMSSLHLAHKYNEDDDPVTNDYVRIADYSITADQLHDKEKEIFILLGCNANIPRDIDYLEVISTISEFSSNFHAMSKNLMLTLKIEEPVYLTSISTTASVHIISELYSEKYINIFNIPVSVISNCVNEIIGLCKRLKKSSLKAFYKFHNTKEWNKLFDMICNMGLLEIDNISTPYEYLKSQYFKEDISIKLISKNKIPKSLGVIGEGSYSVVKKVNYMSKFYAVKKSTLYFDEAITSDFIKEISVLLSLNHPNIAKISYITKNLDIFFELGTGDLKTWLNIKGNMTYNLQFDFVKQMLSSLSYIHKQGCIHRDIKPQNIIVYDSSVYPKFVLSDFGSSSGCQIALRNNPIKTTICTLWYRSPELLLGKKEYNDSVDVWSLLCTIYECATGKVLFKGDSEMHQLSKIFRVLGSPTFESWNEALNLPNYETNLSKWQPIPQFFINNNLLSDCYKELLANLDMNPNKRLTSSELYNVITKYNNIQMKDLKLWAD
jgi:hypothetical protein